MQNSRTAAQGVKKNRLQRTKYNRWMPQRTESNTNTECRSVVGVVEASGLVRAHLLRVAAGCASTAPGHGTGARFQGVVEAAHPLFHYAAYRIGPCRLFQGAGLGAHWRWELAIVPRRCLSAHRRTTLTTFRRTPLKSERAARALALSFSNRFFMLQISARCTFFAAL